MAKIEDVAAYILAARGPMTAMKLQKLCFYSHAWHLVWEEEPLFDARIEAWANGPIVPDLYRMHRGRFTLQPGSIVEGDAGNLDRGEAGSIDVVLDSYGDLSAHQLSELTHSEAPWRSARRRAGLAPMDRGNEQITNQEIFEFYDAMTMADEAAG